MAMKRRWVEEEKKGLTFLLIFISSPLQVVAKKNKKNKNHPPKAGVQSFNTVFKNPGIY